MCYLVSTYLLIMFYISAGYLRIYCRLNVSQVPLTYIYYLGTCMCEWGLAVAHMLSNDFYLMTIDQNHNSIINVTKYYI